MYVVTHAVGPKIWLKFSRCTKLRHADPVDIATARLTVCHVNIHRGRWPALFHGHEKSIKEACLSGVLQTIICEATTDNGWMSN